VGGNSWAISGYFPGPGRHRSTSSRRRSAARPRTSLRGPTGPPQRAGSAGAARARPQHARALQSGLCVRPRPVCCTLRRKTPRVVRGEGVCVAKVVTRVVEVVGAGAVEGAAEKVREDRLWAHNTPPTLQHHCDAGRREGGESEGCSSGSDPRSNFRESCYKGGAGRAQSAGGARAFLSRAAPPYVSRINFPWTLDPFNASAGRDSPPPPRYYLDAPRPSLPY